MVHVPDQVNATLTQAPENAGMVNFMVGKTKHEFYVHEAAPPMNKLSIAVIAAFGFGVLEVRSNDIAEVEGGVSEKVWRKVSSLRRVEFSDARAVHQTLLGFENLYAQIHVEWVSTWENVRTGDFMRHREYRQIKTAVSLEQDS